MRREICHGTSTARTQLNCVIVVWRPASVGSTGEKERVVWVCSDCAMCWYRLANCRMSGGAFLVTILMGEEICMREDRSLSRSVEEGRRRLHKAEGFGIL